MPERTRNGFRYVLLALAGFLVVSAARTAQASTPQFGSNYAVAYDRGAPYCSGNPGKDCDEPE